MPYEHQLSCIVTGDGATVAVQHEFCPWAGARGAYMLLKFYKT